MSCHAKWQGRYFSWPFTTRCTRLETFKEFSALESGQKWKSDTNAFLHECTYRSVNYYWAYLGNIISNKLKPAAKDLNHQNLNMMNNSTDPLNIRLWGKWKTVMFRGSRGRFCVSLTKSFQLYLAMIKSAPHEYLQLVSCLARVCFI